MSDTVFDAGTLVDSAADKLVTLSAQDIQISIQQVITNETFYLWVIVGVVTTLFTTQGWRFPSDIYSRIFTRPVYIGALEIVAFVADVMMASALIYYIWTQRHPPPGQASEWYAAIYGLWFAFEGLKYFWVILFFRWGMTVPGICGAAFLGAVSEIVLTVLVITTGYRGSYAAMGLMIVAWFLYLAAFVFNCVVAYYRVKETPEATGDVSSAVLMTQISRPPFQQQHPQQQQYYQSQQQPNRAASSYPMQQQQNRPSTYSYPGSQAYQRNSVPQGRNMNAPTTR